MKKKSDDLTAVHMINGLSLGGAESMLVNVLKYGTEISKYDNTVITLGKGSYFVPQLQRLGIRVVELDLTKRPLCTVRTIFRLLHGTDVVSSWSYHTNLLALLAKVAGRARLAWIINHEDTARKTNKLPTWIIMHLCALLSRMPDAVAYNGEASKKAHRKLGFRPKAEFVVPNGCDIDVYSPDAASADYLVGLLGEKVRGAEMVLSAGRWHPIKDHAMFISAFAEVARRSEAPVIACLCGPGMESLNPDLMRLIDETQLEVGKNVFLMGPRDDLPQIMAASSVYALHSKSEAFPNVLVQAMSSGAKIVSTDVGIVSQLTGGGVRLVPPEDSDGLAGEILTQLTTDEVQKDLTGRTLRQIIVDDYSIDKVASEYEAAILGP